MNKSNYYPNIEITKRQIGFRYETTIRIKRQGNWYDVIVADIYPMNTAIEIFKDRLIITKLFWEPFEEGSETAKRLGFKGPSNDQRDIEDDLLNDIHTVNRLKRTMDIQRKSFKK